MILGKYILRNGVPVLEPNPLAWAVWFEDVSNRRVLLTERGDTFVSTVFLGIDHGWGQGPPVLWETMVCRAGKWGEQERYASLEGAIAGHHAMVAKVWPQEEVAR